MTVHFEIDYRRCLDPAGNLVGPLAGRAADPDFAVMLYRAMVRARIFDAKAVALQRTGRLGTFASCLGQEAVSLGGASALKPDDVFVPSFREHAGQLWRGVTLLELFLFWGGDERGNDFKGPRADLPISVPVGSHVPHAAGIALAFKLRRERRAALCIFGDGATSKGDVAEALNFAGVWRLPAVFIVCNNRWAISVPRERQTAAETLAQKAIAAGIPGLQVDGNDVFAVHAAASEALERARAGGGAALIEAITYRLGDHTTSDDAARYRDDATVTPHWAEEPVLRLRKYLTAFNGWKKSDEEQLLGEIHAEVDKAADAYLALPAQPVESIFDFVFAQLPPDLARQRDAARAGAP